jgi:hypothetical protein
MTRCVVANMNPAVLFQLCDASYVRPQQQPASLTARLTAVASLWAHLHSWGGHVTAHITCNKQAAAPHTPASKQTYCHCVLSDRHKLAYANALHMPCRQKYGRSYDVSLVQRTYLGKVRHETCWPASLQQQRQLRMQQFQSLCSSAGWWLEHMPTYIERPRHLADACRLTCKQNAQQSSSLASCHHWHDSTCVEP